jgi:hypothetical protein
MLYFCNCCCNSSILLTFWLRVETLMNVTTAFRRKLKGCPFVCIRPTK